MVLIKATVMKMAKGEEEYIAWFTALRQALQASKGSEPLGHRK